MNDKDKEQEIRELLENSRRWLQESRDALLKVSAVGSCGQIVQERLGVVLSLSLATKGPFSELRLDRLRTGKLVMVNLSGPAKLGYSADASFRACECSWERRKGNHQRAQTSGRARLFAVGALR